MKNTKTLITSTELSKLQLDLQAKIQATILALVGKKKVDLGENSFEDKMGNEIIAIDKEDVFFSDGVMDENTYPINDLDIEDAIYIVALLEDSK